MIECEESEEKSELYNNDKCKLRKKILSNRQENKNVKRCKNKKCESDEEDDDEEYYEEEDDDDYEGDDVYKYKRTNPGKINIIFTMADSKFNKYDDDDENYEDEKEED